MKPLLRRLSAVSALMSIACTFLYAQSDPFTVKSAAEIVDSLEKRIPHLNGKEKLDAFTSLVNCTFNIDEDAGTRYIDAMYSEAEEQGRLEYMIFCMIKRMQLQTGRGLLEEGIETLEDAERMSLSDPNHYYLAYLRMTIIQLQMYDGDYASALGRAKDMYSTAKASGKYTDMRDAAEMIGDIYNRMDMKEDALAYYREALRYNREAERDHLEKKKNGHGSFRMVDVDLYENIALILSGLPVSEDLLHYTDSLLMSVESSIRYENKPPEFYHEKMYQAEYFYTRYYVEVGDMAKAEEHLRRAEELLDPQWLFSEGNEDRLNELYCDYYEAAGDYGMAIEYCGKTIDFMRSFGYRVGEAKRMLRKAGLQVLAGEYEAAAGTYADYAKLAAEIDDKEHHDQLDELRTVYELDKIEMQAEQDRLRLQSVRNLVYGLAGILALMAAIAVILVVYGRRMKVKNKGLFEQIRSQDALSAEMEKWKDEAIKLRSFVTPVGNGAASEVEKEDVLYKRFKELMEDPEIYTDQEITRKSVADRLGTNERHLFDMVKKYYGMGFTEYITSLRLAHARHLLSCVSDDYTVEAVAIDSGFGSRVTLHRLFKNNYGMTPDEFRNMVKMSSGLQRSA